jgi:hypothetical protein
MFGHKSNKIYAKDILEPDKNLGLFVRLLLGPSWQTMIGYSNDFLDLCGA